MSRQIWLVARLTAVFVFFSIIVGNPLGNFLAHLSLHGTPTGWNPLGAYGFDVVLFAFIVPILVIFVGYLFSHFITMISAAESIAAAAKRITEPDLGAAQNVQSVGSAVRQEVSALNTGLDDALTRLAAVEAMIRQHVEAIDIAGEAIELKATGAVSRVASERAKLMELTESLNTHADAFAAAIAARANSDAISLEKSSALVSKTQHEFDDRLRGLEDAAATALQGFESLRDALRETEESLKSTQTETQNATTSSVAASQAIKDAAAAASEASEQSAAQISRSAKDAREAAEQALKDQTDQAVAAINETKSSATDALENVRTDVSNVAKLADDVSKVTQKASQVASAAAKNVRSANEQIVSSTKSALEASAAGVQEVSDKHESLRAARADLEKENARLENLIKEQRNRADRLADAITQQTDRLSRLAEKQLAEKTPAKPPSNAQEAQTPLAPPSSAPEREAPTPVPTLAAPTKNIPSTERLNQLAQDIAQRRPASSENSATLNLVGEQRVDTKSDKNAKSPEPISDAPAETPDKSSVSWKQILNAADDADAIALDDEARRASAEARTQQNDAMEIISALQDFTFDVETRLFGEPPAGLRERFERGDRNVFANRILRLNEADIRRRIRDEAARDRQFERQMHEFLQSFERLLEDATTSETADEELEEYLSSPMGRVYLLIGATVGYFA